MSLSLFFLLPHLFYFEDFCKNINNLQKCFFVFDRGAVGRCKLYLRAETERWGGNGGKRLTFFCGQVSDGSLVSSPHDTVRGRSANVASQSIPRLSALAPTTQQPRQGDSLRFIRHPPAASIPAECDFLSSFSFSYF